MNIDNLKSLVFQKESHTLEFKKSMTQLKAAFETLCGFLNGNGGTVVIGVTDSGKIIGANITDSSRQEIAHELSKIEPFAQISVTYIPVDDNKEVIVLQTENYLYPPYVFNARPFVRNQSTTSKMSQHQYEQLLIRRNHLNYAWDEAFAPEHEVNELDHEQILKTLHQGISINRISAGAAQDSIEEILIKLNLMKNNRLTNAAIVLFSKNVAQYYTQCHIMMARFKGTTRLGQFLDNQSLYGNLFTILEESSLFIQRHMSIASSYQENSFERIDRPDLPILAIREALINALCHRDYSPHSSHISLAIYDDRLEIWNPGKLPEGLKIDDLKEAHESKQRNKLISDIIYRRGLIESWGTGTLKMIELCKEHNLPEPEFKEYSGGFSVIFKITNPQPLPLIGNIYPEDLNVRQINIITLLQEYGSLSPRDIISTLNETISERTLRFDLAKLKKMGILNNSGQANNTVWFIKK